jgi:hypothetical protein
MDGNSGSRRSLLGEVLSINFIVTRKIGHVHQERRNFHNVAQFRADACEDIANVLDHGASLEANIEPDGAVRINLGSRDLIVRTARAGSRNKQIVPCSFHMREPTPRLRLSFNDFSFRHHGNSLLMSRSRHSLTQMLFSSE